MTLETTFEAADGHEITLELDISFENTGIGAYEYWGAKCYDHGMTVMSDCDIDVISGGEPGHDYKKEAEEWIVKNWADIEESAMSEAARDRDDMRIEQAIARREANE